MANHRFTALLIASLAWVAPGHAADANGGTPAPGAARTLSLRQALEYGIGNNLDLRIREIDLPIGRDEVIVGESAFDPALDAGLDAQTRNTPLATGAGDDAELLRATGAGAGIGKRYRSGLDSRLGLETQRTWGDVGGSLNPEYRSFLVLDLTQPLLRDRGAAVNTADLRVSENRVQQAICGALARAQQVVADVEVTYLDLALFQEISRLRARSRDLAQELALGNREKLDAGTVPITEVQQAETAVAARDEQVVAARQGLEVAQEQLKDLLNVSTGSSLYAAPIDVDPLPGIDTPVPELARALTTALQTRPDLQIQQTEIANRDIRLAFFDNQTLPRLDLEGSLGLNGLSGTGSGSHEGPYGESWSDTATGEGYQWFAGVRFSFPLGNRAAKARQRQAGYQKSQEIYRLKRLERSAETEVNTALVTVERSLERFRVAERFMSLAQRTLEQEGERLGEGLSDTFRILQFQDDLIEAQVRRATALADYHKGLAQLYRAMGSNLERYDIVYDIDGKEIPHV